MNSLADHDYSLLVFACGDAELDEVSQEFLRRTAENGTRADVTGLYHLLRNITRK